MTGVDGNRTHQGRRKPPLNGFEGRGTEAESGDGTESVSGDDTTTYDGADAKAHHAADSALTALLTHLDQNRPDLAAAIRALPDLPESVRAEIGPKVKGAKDG